MASGQADGAERTQAAAGDQLAGRLIRELVESYPQTMSILGPLGIDLCCGGGHSLGDALDLHGLDRDRVLAQVTGVVEAAHRSAPER